MIKCILSFFFELYDFANDFIYDLKVEFFQGGKNDNWNYSLHYIHDYYVGVF